MKTCKPTMVTTLLVMLFCLISTNIVLGQPDPPKTRSGARIQKTNWSNSMGCTYGDTVCVSLWEDDVLWLKLIVDFADPLIGNYPAMHFRYHFPVYSFNPQYPLIGMTDAVTPDIIEPTVLENGDSAWRASFLFQFDLSEFCGPDKHIPFPLTYQLMTPTSTGHIPYPVAAFPTLFPADTFYVDSTGLAPEMKTTKEMCCYGESFTCSPDAVHPYHRNSAEDNRLSYNGYGEQEDMARSEKEKESIRIFPNPFSRIMTVSMMEEDLSATTFLRVYDTQGKLVFQQSNFEINNAGDLIIPTEQWSPGIYFFHFLSNQDSKILKAVKY